MQGMVAQAKAAPLQPLAVVEAAALAVVAAEPGPPQAELVAVADILEAAPVELYPEAAELEVEPLAAEQEEMAPILAALVHPVREVAETMALDYLEASWAMAARV
jgi:hypothetical protein